MLLLNIHKIEEAIDDRKDKYGDYSFDPLTLDEYIEYLRSCRRFKSVKYPDWNLLLDEYDDSSDWEMDCCC